MIPQPERAHWRRLTLSVLCGLIAAVAVGGFHGAVAGTATGVAGYWLFGQRARRDRAAEQRQVAAELPFTAELLAAALRAGAAPDAAATSVAEAVGGPMGKRLTRVGGALRLGATAEEAWSYLGDVDGRRRLVQAADRTQHSGAAFAGSLQRLAEDLRADRLTAAEAAARRAGVLIVLPLGLCFLPAFVLAGLVPVIVAVLGDVVSP